VIEFESAKNFYFDQQYQKAVSGFNSFISRYPESASIQDAKYYLAESYYRGREYDKAMFLYTELSKDMTFAMGNKVVGRTAEIEFRQAQYEKAVSSFHQLEKMAASKKELYTAWSGLMESFFMLSQYDSVFVYANLIIEKGNVDAGAQNKATLFIGKSSMAKGDYETAKDEFLNTLNTARDEYGAEAKYRLGEIFFLTKQHVPCKETLFGLIGDFGSYDEWVGKSFLLLADNYLAMGETFQAKETLQSLIDNKFPLLYIQNAAKDKLKVIEETELKEKQKIQADTLDNNR
jgi:TolA-binding protein